MDLKEIKFEWMFLFLWKIKWDRDDGYPRTGNLMFFLFLPFWY